MEKENQLRLPRVRLKGVGDSLWVTLDPEAPVDYLQEELGRLFRQTKKLALNARVIIDMGEKENYGELVEYLEKYLKENFGVRSVSVKHPLSEEQDRKRDVERSWQHYRSDSLILTGRVRSGQRVTARKHLMILGDVNPGAEVLAGGDILIMGRLRGTVAAGQPDNEDSIVLALDFQPTQVQIGKVVAAGLPPSSSGKAAEFAYIEKSAIIVEDYLNANPFGRLPWPQVR